MMMDVTRSVNYRTCRSVSFNNVQTGFAGISCAVARLWAKASSELRRYFVKRDIHRALIADLTSLDRDFKVETRDTPSPRYWSGFALSCGSTFSVTSPAICRFRENAGCCVPARESCKAIAKPLWRHVGSHADDVQPLSTSLDASLV
jgi:hypothetical protein